MNPANDRREWYCEQSGATAGPFSLQELRFLKDRNKLTATDRVRQGLQGPWIPAKTVIEFPSLPKTSRPREPAAVGSSQAAKKHSTGRQSEDSSNGESVSGSLSTEPEGDVEENLVQPTVPPALPRRGNSKDVRKKVLLGTGIGAGLVLLFLLLFWLLSSLFSRVPGGAGGLLAQGRGAGANAGDAVGTEAGKGAGGQSGNAAPQGSAERASADSDSESSAANPAGQSTPQNRKPTSPATINPLDSPAPAPTKKGGGGGGLGLGGGGSEGDGIEFFGVKGRGNDFVYIVDCSGSMSGAPFTKACAELKESLSALKSRQTFYVYFYSSSSYPMFYPQPAETDLLRASKKNVKKVNQWVDGFNGSGGTNPTEALILALKLEPDTIFLLTDGAFNDSVLQTIRQQNTGKQVVINTIGFMNRGGESLLKQIAEENKGTYRFVP